MLNYVSTKGGIAAVDFETAILQGFAEDGGLFVPEHIPAVTKAQLCQWSELSFNDLAFEILSLYIDVSIIPEGDLKQLIETSTGTFSHPDIVPVVTLDSKTNHFAMELFHGPTLSFKDIAMGFLMNTMDYFLQRKGASVSLLLATTGDTGPAAAYASRGKKTIDCWPLYPSGFISEEQTRQMTTLDEDNVHPIAVENCPNGGDDLDIVIAQLFSDPKLVKDLKLSSVNSINWCRVMFQSIHYFYGYFQVAKKIEEEVIFSVPTGAFGHLFAGYLAREMGLPIATFICANNRNGAVHQVFENAVLSKHILQKTPSSAIDITQPYNFWRFLYFVSGRDSKRVTQWMSDYLEQGYVEFDDMTMKSMKQGVTSAAISDEETLSTIARVYQGSAHYLLDPHGAVAVAAANKLSLNLSCSTAIISLLTAHPAKFPEVTRQALQPDDSLPTQAIENSIEKMKCQTQKMLVCDYSELRDVLLVEMAKTEHKQVGCVVQ